MAPVRCEAGSLADCVTFDHRPLLENVYSGMLEASAEAVTEWLSSPGFELRLFSFFPCTDITPSLANKVREGSLAWAMPRSWPALLPSPLSLARAWHGQWLVTQAIALRCKWVLAL